MKNIIYLLLILILGVSCGVSSSSNINIDPNNILYVKDIRTGLCFGFVASRKTTSLETTGLGMTCVPCENVEKYLNNK